MPFDRAVEDADSTPQAKPSRHKALPILSCLGMAAAAIAFAAVNSEAVVARAFDHAFASLDRPATAKLASRSYDGISGSEEFWLRAEPNSDVVKAVSVGQQITLNANGTERRLTVTGISGTPDFADQVEAKRIETTHIATGADAAHSIVITCREGDVASGREVRLYLDAGQITELPNPARSAPRAL